MTIETPLDGKLASFTDKIPYKVTVTDPEDGTTAASSAPTSRSRSRSAMTSTRTTCRARRAARARCRAAWPPATARRPTRSRSSRVTYTDKGGPGGIVPLTGRARGDPAAQDRSRRSSSPRPAATPDGTTGGTAGVQIETTADTEGGGSNIGFIEDGDYTSYKPFNLTDITEARFRVASRRPGRDDRAALRLADRPAAGQDGDDHADRQLADLQERLAAADRRAGGTHELFVITRNPGQTASLLNLNWIDFVGKGAAQTAAPEVTSTATPLTGAAPLPVAFDDDRDRSRRRDARLRVGLRRARHDDGHVDAAVATYTYANQGNYTATLTVTDGQGGTTVKTFAIRVTAPAGCGTTTATTSTAPTSAPAGTSCGATRAWSCRRDAEDPDRAGRRLRRRQQRQEHRAARGAVRPVDDHDEGQSTPATASTTRRA